MGVECRFEMIEALHDEFVEAVYPLSPLQQGMLFHSLYGRQSGVDIEQLLAELPEALNVTAFQRAWQRVVERHAMLRTSFHWNQDDQPCQQVRREVRIHWDLKDWQGLSARQQEKRLEAHLQADRGRGFDLTLAPLMRLGLIRVGPSKYWMVWSFHHLLLDGRSLVVLFNELFAYYDAICSRYDLEIQPPPSFRDHIRWLEQQDLAPAETYWRRRFHGFTAPALWPAGAPAGGATLDIHPDPAEQERRLSASLAAALRRLAREHELTLNILVQGAWALVLSRAMGQSDVVFGAIRACRHAGVSGIASIVGLLINTVPVRVQIDASAKFIDWLKELRSEWVALRPYEHTPLPKVQEWSGVHRGQPLFETLLNVQDPSWDAALRAQGGRWSRRRSWVKSQPNYPLAVDVYAGREITVKMWYNRRRFGDKWIGRLLEQLSRVLEGMVENPKRRVGELPWLSDEERRRVVIEWNQTDLDYPRDRCVPEMIEEQVRQRADAIAVADVGEALSYADLNCRAGRVAERLRELGVGTDQLVGVCLHRSARMVAAMLGVWKAGGAYVPLEASYPDDRLKYMVEDAKLKVILTQRSLIERMAFQGVPVVCLEDLLGRNSGKEHGFAHGIPCDDLDQAMAQSPVSPHPAPLPQGEGMAKSDCRTTGRARLFEAEPAILPLPKGEGRGEGEGTADNPPDTSANSVETLGGSGSRNAVGKRTQSNQLAYVIYTSGSTGRPKGVEVEHGSLANLTAWHLHTYKVTPADRATQLAGSAYDACVWELWPYLAAGASVFVADEKTRLSPRKLIEWLAQERITIGFLPTPLAHAVMNEPWPEGMVLRALLTGGEKLLRRPGRSFPCPLVNNYGPTENTVVATWTLVEPGSSRRKETRSPQSQIATRKPQIDQSLLTPAATVPDSSARPVERDADTNDAIPIGRPISNVQVYILDPSLEPVPVGVPGELCIAGRSLARGYRHQPAATAERFLPNAYSGAPGERLYRTGDLVRYRADGAIEFLGRIDQQVKLRGHRVEPGEIEFVLSQHDDVAQAAVAVRQNGCQEPRLVAFVVPKCGRQVSGSQLREFLKRKLPEYMVPAAFTVLDALPLTANGKVNRDALPATEAEPETIQEFVSPRTPVEEALAAIWEDVLLVRRVGIHDNFFDLGGHSMLATQVMSRIYRLFQLDLPVRDLFECPTVAALAERIDLANRVSPRSGVSDQLPVVSGQLPISSSKSSSSPVSFAQERLWFLEQLEPNQTFDHVPVGVRIEGPLSLDAWRASWIELVRRHESLRTVFRTVHGQLSACVVDCDSPILGGTRDESRLAGDEGVLALPWAVIDVRHVPEGPRAGEFARLIQGELRRPFDLTVSPLWRARLVRLAEEEHFLILNLHHSICDGWSLGVLFRELKMLYEAARSGRSVSLPALPIRYSDFAIWQRDWMQGETLERHLAYWKKQLHGPPPRLNLPTDRPRPSAQLYHGAKVFFALPSALATALRKLSRREDVTQFMLLLGALQTLLWRYSGQDDIVVGSPIGGRRRVETEGLIGLFANTLVLRGDLSGDPTFRELLSRVRRTALDAYAHQDIPFEKLVEGVEAERNLSYSPLFQVMFIFQRGSIHPMEMGGLRLEPQVLDNGTSKFDLTLSLEEWEDNLSGFVEYDTALFDPATITRMLAHYQTLLESVVANPNQRLSRLPMLSPDEKEQMIERWNRTQTRFSSERSVCELFRDQVSKSPHAVAVTCEERRLTYAELDARSDEVALRLQSLGVGPEMLVGILLEPSIEMIVALIATLKAGGAYLPLDPTYPQERLAFMLNDARPKVVLTQKQLQVDLPAFGGSVIDLDSLQTRTEASNSRTRRAQIPRVRIRPDRLAYVIYTSGSTGKPKGVCIPHRGLANFLHAMGEELGVTNHDVLLAVTTLSFDIAALEIFLPLAVGAQVVVVDRETATDGRELARQIAQSRATFMQATPATWRLLLESGWEGDTSLKILCGGESLPRPLADSLLNRAGALWNLYGPTETTIWSAIHRVGPGEGLVPIGRPIANTQLYILDRHQQPVPAGVAGELYIGGAGVARGYLNRPELTAERFVPKPFLEATRPEAARSDSFDLADKPELNKPGRLYRTGDLARFRSDGVVEFLGRIDHQVKLRGYRIEPGEIEAALVRHPGVREALVTLNSQEPDCDRLVAYVVVRAHCSVSFSELREFLSDTLPAPMIPSQFVLLDAFPLTLNGKIDRKALPVPRLSPRLEKAELTAPRTPLEEVLAEIWSKLFGLERVGVEENFFRLGGHSLLAVQLLARIRTVFEMELPLRTLFEAPTIERLTQAIIHRESAPGQAQRLAQLIKRVQGMSSKDVRKALRKTNATDRSVIEDDGFLTSPSPRAGECDALVERRERD